LNEISTYTGRIRDKAAELGFDGCGFARAGELGEDADVLRDWLRKGMHAGMSWMENHLSKRVDPTRLVPDARTVVSVIVNYYNPGTQKDPEAPVISRYAYGRDYHRVVRKKLKNLLSYISEIIPGTSGRVFVDSAPVMEHAWAVKSGLGWIGKNSLLLTKKYGSYVFIGEVIIDKELEYDNALTDHCGQCRLCIDECPTHAINENRTVNAGKCISYLTIEHQGEIPGEFKRSFYNRVFGCDICQDVCPWNRKAVHHTVPDFQPSEELMSLDRTAWYGMSEEKFNEIFEGSAVKRTGYKGIRRNLDYLR
jgi:epoxyqueuosine reductase